MIDFKPLQLEQKEQYLPYLLSGGSRGCEYSFCNLFLWGRQQAAVVCDRLVLFSQFNRRSVYPFPVGSGEIKPVLDAIIADAAERGIPCRITGMLPEERELLDQLYPGKFCFHCDRDSYDYVYGIDDLADLKGRKFQKKRNHYNRFRDAFPYYTVQPLDRQLLPKVKEMIAQWYAAHLEQDPSGDFQMEQAAISRALECYEELDMEALVLLDGEQVLAVTMGSFLSGDTMDVHFEKARPDVEGAYAVINCEFARYLRGKYPDLRYLNREDDMGLEGLRKAKLSYCPHHMVEKCWAHLLEDGYAY